MTRRDRALTIGLLGLALLYVASHVAALFTEGANWDEFALLHRAQDSIISGTLKGGGRPGLSVLIVLPFVDGCTHVMRVVHQTRLLWAFLTFSAIGGLFTLLRIVTRRSNCSLHAAALGTASYALVPIFLRWSLHVRTDQIAIASAIWGGVALMAKRPRWWIVAGALFAVGYLSSQKVVYAIVLVGLLAAGDLYIGGTADWRRELRRFGSVIIGACVALAAFQISVRLAFAPARVMSVNEGLDLFRWYRTVLAFRLYRDIVPTVLPQIGLLVLVFVAAFRAFRRETEERRALLVALLVMLLGGGVARFHTASFPYFWITIGVFPACAIGLGWQGIRVLMPRMHVVVAFLAWSLMIVLAVDFRCQTLHDTQRPQRESFGFVESLPSELRGFNTDGGLICRRDPDPFPVFLGQHVQERFFGPNGPAYTEQFFAEHRNRPVAFIVRSNRVNFTTEVHRFWAEHYVRYFGAVWLAGRQITGPAGKRIAVDILVPGKYRWLTAYGASLSIAGSIVAPGGTIELSVGPHIAELQGASGDGMLALAVDREPSPDPTVFYDWTTIRELSGVRRGWW